MGTLTGTTLQQLVSSLGARTHVRLIESPPGLEGLISLNKVMVHLAMGPDGRLGRLKFAAATMASIAVGVAPTQFAPLRGICDQPPAQIGAASSTLGVAALNSWVPHQDHWNAGQRPPAGGGGMGSSTRSHLYSPPSVLNLEDGARTEYNSPSPYRAQSSYSTPSESTELWDAAAVERLITQRVDAQIQARIAPMQEEVTKLRSGMAEVTAKLDANASPWSHPDFQATMRGLLSETFAAGKADADRRSADSSNR